MTTLPLLKDVLTPALVRALGFALLHSLWQGAVLAGALAAALALLRRQRPELRYWLAVSTLALLVLVVSGTFGRYYAVPVPVVPGAALSLAPARFRTESPATAASTEPAASVAPAEVSSEPAAHRWAGLVRRVEPYLPVLVAAWLLGLLLMSGRLAGGLLYAGRLRRAAQPIRAGGGGEASWPARLAALARRAGLRRPVQLLESARVAGPLVLGHLRPVILLPLGAVAALPPALLEALLAHEVAHLLRRDYLLNLALVVVETVFFYHPAVWFVAACLRAERENCCDDRAAALCGGDRLRVARALAALAELTVLPTVDPVPRLALAATGPEGARGSLLARVRRLALGQAPAPAPGEGLLAAGLLLLSLLGLSTGVVLAGAPLRADARQFVRERLTGGQLTSRPTPADTTRRKATAATAPVPAVPAATPPSPPPAVPAAPSAPAAASAASALPAPPASPLPPDTLRRARRRVFADEAAPGSVVIRKDRKGRLTDLVVNGQRVETAASGRKRRGRGEEVEVIQLPAPPLPPLPPHRLRRLRRLESGAVRADVDGAVFSFNLDTERFRRQMEQVEDESRETARESRETARESRETARQSRETARQSRATARDSRETARESRVKSLRIELNTRSGGAGKSLKYDYRPRFRMPGDSSRIWFDDRRHVELRIETSPRLAPRQQPARARTPEAAARQAELRARIAEARARLDAREAELCALEDEASQSEPGPPPNPPRLPRTPGGPPAPPAPPRTDRLRDALRRDGLLKADERSYSVDLDEKGGRFNGRPLTPEQAARYRQLLRSGSRPAGGQERISISVNEK